MATENIKIFTIKVDTKTGKVAVDDLTKGFVKQETAVKSLNNEITNLNNNIEENAKGLNKQIDKTGLAGAAVVEIGRTISDANYGFTAMANNISQLTTLFVTLIATTKGVKNAFIALRDAFMGPLGVIVLFQVAIAVYEKFKMSQKEAADSINGVTDSLNANIVVANKYIKILEDTNISENKRAEIIEQLKKLVPSLKDEDFKYAEQLELVRQKIIDYSIAQASRLEIDKLVEKNSEVLAKQRRITLIEQIEDEQQRVEAIKKFFKDEQMSLTENVAAYDTSMGRYVKAVAKTDEQIKTEFKDLSGTISSETEPILNRIEELTKGFDFSFSDDPKDKSRREKRIRIFKEQLLDFESEEQKYRNEALKSEAVYEEDKIEIRRESAQEDLRIKLENFRVDQALRLEQFLFQLDLDKKTELSKAKTDKERAAIEKRYRNASLDGIIRYNNSLIEANANYLNALDVLNKSFNTQTTAFFERQALDDLQGFVEQMQIANDLAKMFQIDMATNEIDRLDAQDELRQQQFDREKFRLEEQIKLDKSRGFQTEELEGKLANLKKKNIQDEEKLNEKKEKAKLAIANQVGNAIIGIAGEGSAVGKSVAVAMAIMNTKEAITNALGAKPYGPWNIAQALAVGAFGFKQVQDIINTKIPGKAGSAAGVGAGGAAITTEAPDFNVVGIGQASQLGQVIGSQFGQPIRAYVVSNDVNTGQALERSITGNAKLD